MHTPEPWVQQSRWPVCCCSGLGAFPEGIEEEGGEVHGDVHGQRRKQRTAAEACQSEDQTHERDLGQFEGVVLAGVDDGEGQGGEEEGAGTAEFGSKESGEEEAAEEDFFGRGRGDGEGAPEEGEMTGGGVGSGDELGGGAVEPMAEEGESDDQTDHGEDVAGEAAWTDGAEGEVIADARSATEGGEDAAEEEHDGATDGDGEGEVESADGEAADAREVFGGPGVLEQQQGDEGEALGDGVDEEDDPAEHEGHTGSPGLGAGRRGGRGWRRWFGSHGRGSGPGQVGRAHRGERGADGMGGGQSIGREGLGHRDAAHTRREGGLDAVDGVLDDGAAGRVEVEFSGCGEEDVGGWFFVDDVFGRDHGIPPGQG